MKPGAKPIFRTSLSFIKHQATQTAILTDTLSLLRPRHPALAAALLHPASASPPPALGVEAVPQSPRILHMHMSCTCACACTRLPLWLGPRRWPDSRAALGASRAPRGARGRGACLSIGSCVSIYEARVADATRACVSVCASTAEAYGPTETRRTHAHAHCRVAYFLRPCSQSATPSAHSN